MIEKLNLMKIIRPKTLGTLEIKVALAGNFLVTNGIGKPPNKISIPCESYQNALGIIEKLKNANTGELIHI